ncbi:flavin-dependent oxidoreductase [Actinophytocola oryzae]|uniref:2-polyprenyl-6-methoxyphenol hydroxylase-like FAD-dependent oxidoreductase n=1 Tax=Actinophytocola oryzae TaxID=502181 RepID=A0A4R7VY25_9PSEU|nr:flavin-dependent oxidoreductase [Actinophytocola oryzae]TDV54902.1 2-polyprenyl-6-methoxyphenol hydroxylase-like FAD-dependent oxidoreductase [Actinophytocola oryzae]
MSVLVVGAGIAGLTTALSLHAAGVECRIVDRARELSALGVGINLQPHAVRELTELGLGDLLAEHGVPTAEVVHFDRLGNRIWSEPRGVGAGYRWPQYSIHRGTLQMLLLRAVEERLGTDAVRTGAAFVSCAQTATGVSVRLRTRGGGEESVEADAVVGADGLHSAVRAQLHPDEGPPVGSGIRMWRGTAERAPFLGGATMIVAGTMAVAKFVAYPITPVRDGRTTVNWVAEVRTPGNEDADWTTVGRLDDVLPHYADWRLGWLDLPELLRASDPILEYPMVDRDPLPHWGNGRITLAGDAAHPMYPIGSNGGSQAILDARVLARHLATAPDTATALARYETERREPTNRILLANRTLGPDRILRLVAERAPAGFEHVSEVLSEDELAEIGASYRHTTSMDVQVLNSRPSWSVSRTPR